MNKTITIVVSEDGGLQFVAGGFDLDEAGLRMAGEALRRMTWQVERLLIAKELEKEREDEDSAVDD